MSLPRKLPLLPVNPALETLLLAFSGECPLPVPERALFLGAEPHPRLSSWPEISGWQPLKPLANAWQNAGFSLTESPVGEWPLILLLPGKSRDETLATFAIAHDLLAPGGQLVVAMPNSAGASRFEKELSKAACGIHSLQKNKCRAFHCTRHAAWNQNLLDEWRDLGKPRLIPDTPFITQAGVFSANRIDPGSVFLTSHLPAGLSGRIADPGAGWGYLSHFLLTHCPNIQQLDLFEADSRALACARQNLSTFSERNIQFHWHDVTAGLTGPYDAIVMNPPFHIGQTTDAGLGGEFIRQAAISLRRGGRLFLVANRQLPYEAIFTECNLAWRKHAEDATYKLLFAERR